MKLSAVLLSHVLLATSVLASPRGLAERVAQRAARTSRHSNTLNVIEESFVNSTYVQYSSNWAGAVLTAPPAGQTFNAVSATFTIPTPAAPTSGSGSWAASAWVGIDGDTYQNAILQTGIDFTITKSGGSSSISYDAWYEWFPNYAYDFSGITLSAGDVVSVSVVSSSSTSGKATITNLSTSQTVSKSLSSTARLGGQNAEWIVEDFSSGGKLVPFANFGTVDFTSAVAKTNSQSVGTTGATIIDIETSGGTVLTSVSIPSSSEVVVSYV
jgi:Peptidase A4 family